MTEGDAPLAEDRPQGEAGVLVHDVSALRILWAFLVIGARSWGGGSGTIYVMLQQLVTRGWITQAQFTLDFGLSRLVPGINLLAVAVMLGYRLGGLPGSGAAMIGLMLPPSLVTVALTIGFVELTANAVGASVVRGMVPVTAALTFALAYEQGSAIMPWGEIRSCVLMVTFAALSFSLVTIYHVPVAFVIVAGILLGALVLRPSRTEPT
jgi:chromate transporter